MENFVYLIGSKASRECFVIDPAWDIQAIEDAASADGMNISGCQLKAGKSHEEILTFFTERYGPWILRVPPKTGVSILAWALAVLLTGPLAVWFLVWRRRDNLGGVEAVKPLEEILAEWNRDITKRRNILNSSLPDNEGSSTLATEGGDQA